MTTSVTCALTGFVSCESTTGCALSSGECEIDMTQYDTAEVEALLGDTSFVQMTTKSDQCEAYNATECSAYVNCEFEGACGTDGVYITIWLSNTCPTLATRIVKLLVADGVTQVEVQAEADAAGITISSAPQAEMDAQGVWSAY